MAFALGSDHVDGNHGSGFYKVNFRRLNSMGNSSNPPLSSLQYSWLYTITSDVNKVNLGFPFVRGARCEGTSRTTRSLPSGLHPSSLLSCNLLQEHAVTEVRRV